MSIRGALSGRVIEICPPPVLRERRWKSLFPSPLAEVQAFHLRAGEISARRICCGDLQKLMAHDRSRSSPMWGLMGSRQVWILAALCLMEGDDALISQSVSYPMDFRSQTGSTDRHKSAADNIIMTGGLWRSTINTVFLLNQGCSPHLHQSLWIQKMRNDFKMCV